VLNLVIAESALERVPASIQRHPSVVKHAQRVGKRPDQLLLDRTYHHAAMIELDRAERRGRPDIIHMSLLAALGTPLNKEGLLRVFVHTIENKVINVNPETRLPKNYNRFVRLIEQLYEDGKVPREGPTLLSLEDKNLKGLMQDIGSPFVVALTRIGKPSTLLEVAGSLTKCDKPTVMVGGFPRGHFEKEIIDEASQVISIDPETLDTWIVVSRVLYEYEKTIGLTEKRLKKIFKGEVKDI